MKIDRFVELQKKALDEYAEQFLADLEDDPELNELDLLNQIEYYFLAEGFEFFLEGFLNRELTEEEA